MVIDDGKSDDWESAGVKSGQALLEASGHSLCTLSKGAATPCGQYDIGALVALHVHNIQQ